MFYYMHIEVDFTEFYGYLSEILNMLLFQWNREIVHCSGQTILFRYYSAVYECFVYEVFIWELIELQHLMLIN